MDAGGPVAADRDLGVAVAVHVVRDSGGAHRRRSRCRRGRRRRDGHGVRGQQSRDERERQQPAADDSRNGHDRNSLDGPARQCGDVGHHRFQRLPTGSVSAGVNPGDQRCADFYATTTLWRVTIRAGMAAGHRSTAEAGAEILARGGNAVDAAVATMLVSCAAETIFTGLAGGGFATVYDAATGTVTCVDFFVAVPGLGGRQAGPGREIEVIFVGQRVPYEIGPATVAVPGVPAGALPPVAPLGPAAVGRRGRAGPAGLVRDAVPAAPTPTLLPQVAPAMCVGEGERVYRRADGSLLQAGDPLRHPDHHRAYELLAERPGRLLPRGVRRRDARRAGRRRCADARPTSTPTGWSSRAPRPSGWTASRCTPAATTSTTCSARCSAAAAHVTGDPHHRPGLGARPWSRRCARPTGGPRRPTSSRSTSSGDGVRDHHQPGSRVRRLGARLRGAPQLDARRGRAGPRACCDAGRADGLDDVAAGGAGRPRSAGARGRRGRRQPDPAGAGPDRCCACCAAPRRRRPSTRPG